ncbi:MAG: hypothetical protein U0838_10140 [Chloroflexota bacterium]
MPLPAGPNFVAVRLLPDDADGSWLFVEAFADGFSGHAQCLIGTGQVSAFARELQSFPLPEAGAVLVSGSWPLGAAELQELIRIDARRVGKLGQVGLVVHLATEESPTRREVRLEVLTTYERLRQFADELSRMGRAEYGNARIEAEVLGRGSDGNVALDLERLGTPGSKARADAPPPPGLDSRRTPLDWLRALLGRTRPHT